jgi:hypothetical protein
MPYHSSSDEEINNAASSTTASKRGRLLPGRNLRRRRGDVNVNVDSSDENNNDGDDVSPSPSLTRKFTEDKTEILDSGNQMMSPLSQEAEGQPQPQSQPRSPSQTQQNRILEDPDPDTMRILISTDNHLGYAENDNVRGNDSFAALEEVLYLAKEYSCDMVMLAGDLFHENRPSRRTLYKTSKMHTTFAVVYLFVLFVVSAIEQNVDATTFSAVA